MSAASQHVPVLPTQLASILKSEKGFQLRSLLDATLGAGGHSQSLLRAHPEIESYFGLDRDSSALKRARAKLIEAGVLPQSAIFWHAPYSEASALLLAKHSKCDAIILDLGVSTDQLISPDRGFSVWRDAPLDMRMNRLDDVTAGCVVNKMPLKRLESLLASLEVKRAKRLAKAICDARAKSPIKTTFELIGITRPHLLKTGKTHPATLLFQALRIAVNDELGQLQSSLHALAMSLAPGGRLAIISFHSLEDRIVKTSFRQLCCEGPFISLTKKPLVPMRDEIAQNRKARSAKLRAIARHDGGD